MTKYIFIDFDGTLMDIASGTIPQSAYTAIRKLKEKGHVPFIATGKNLYLLEDHPKELGIDHIVGSNGGFVYYNDQLIYQNKMNEESLKDLVEKLQKEKIDYAFSTHDLYVSHQRFDTHMDNFSYHFNMLSPKIDTKFNDYEHVYQMNIFSEKELPRSLIQSSPFHFLRANFLGYDVSEDIRYKESGLAFVKENLDLKEEQIVAIGDGLNDVGMIAYAYVGIAMGNAQRGAKEVARYVTDNVANDGLYKALKHFDLID